MIHKFGFVYVDDKRRKNDIFGFPPVSIMNCSMLLSTDAARKLASDLIEAADFFDNLQKENQQQ